MGYSGRGRGGSMGPAPPTDGTTKTEEMAVSAARKMPHCRDSDRRYLRRQRGDRQTPPNRQKGSQPSYRTQLVRAKSAKARRGKRNFHHKQHYRHGAPTHPNRHRRTGEERVPSPQTRVRYTPPSSTGASRLEPLCSHVMWQAVANETENRYHR